MAEEHDHPLPRPDRSPVPAREFDPALEDSLRRALREPVPVPEGFAAQVLAQAHGPRAPAQAWQKVLAAVLVLMLSLAGYTAWHTRQVREARQTVAGFALAMEIAHTALAESATDARSQVRGAVETINLSHTGKAEQ